MYFINNVILGNYEVEAEYRVGYRWLASGDYSGRLARDLSLVALLSMR